MYGTRPLAKAVNVLLTQPKVGAEICLVALGTSPIILANIGSAKFRKTYRRGPFGILQVGPQACTSLSLLEKKAMPLISSKKKRFS